MPVIIPDSIRPQPEPHEIEVARLLSLYFHADATFLVPSLGYKMKTPDIMINGVAWEIKSPIGNSKTTIDKQVKDGIRQASSLVIDGTRTKLTDETVILKLQKEAKVRKRMRRLLYIDKKAQVITIK